jgi:hypothetical protein
MEKRSTCPGCKAKFRNGRPFSVHIRCCKTIDSAANIALKKHKIITAKKIEAKKARIAAAKNVAASSSQRIQDAQEMDLDNDVDMQEVGS